MAHSAAESNKRKPGDKLSEASRRKMAKEASLKIDTSKCIKLTSFMTKLPVVQSVEVPAEIKQASELDDQHPAGHSSTEHVETEIPPSAASLQHKQADPKFEAVEQQLAADIIQEPLLP